MRSGALAGGISAFTFTFVHDIFISDIWFSTIPMVIAGILCGLCLAWSYSLLFSIPGYRSLLVYKGLYLGMFVLLGIVSILLFEPITTVAAVIAANGPPNELFGKAMPMTLIYLFTMAGLLSFLYGRKWKHYGVILLTCAVLILLLGLNVSVIGLVFVPLGSFHLILELFALIFVLDFVYIIAYILLERNTFLAKVTGSSTD